MCWSSNIPRILFWGHLSFMILLLYFPYIFKLDFSIVNHSHIVDLVFIDLILIECLVLSSNYFVLGVTLL
jgi:hypothetical protein